MKTFKEFINEGTDKSKAIDWWRGLSVREQNTLIKKHFPKEFPIKSVVDNTNDIDFLHDSDIIELWEKEHENL